jgi:DNA-binding SARP family transcriptional activator/tetratricopeptide (TPR) repeat protein
MHPVEVSTGHTQWRAAVATGWVRGDTVEFRLLGPIDVRVAGARVEAGPPRQRCVLAALAIDAGRPVPVETLVDRVWGLEPPGRARHALYVYVARLRKLLLASEVPNARPVGLVRRSGGYLLDVQPGQVDVHRFQHLVAMARDETTPAQRRVVLLRTALDLWRDAPLADLSGDWVDRVRQGWQQRNLDAVTAWARATLSAGDPAVAIGPLTELVERHPLNELLVAALMRVLHGAGRTGDALDHFARIRGRLAEQLGTEPDAGLCALHRALLRGDPVDPIGAAGPTGAAGVPRRLGSGGEAPPAPVEPVEPVASVDPADLAVVAGSATPALLPADVPAFTGRRDAMARLDALLPQGAPPSGDARPSGDGRMSPGVAIAAVSGAAGVGKTSLAVHWAHRVRDRFPDGQLYANLRSWEPAGSVMTPAEAVRRFLDAMRVPPQRIPAGLDAQLDLYHSLLVGRRILLVLDNARDAEQVRPLLPAAGSVVTVVTSRNQLTGLAATDGAHLVALDTLPRVEAGDLLAGRLGAGRVAAEQGAVKAIVTACAGLPLALSIAAARAQQTGFPLATLATELGDAENQLDALDTGDPATQVRAVFSWSYTACTPAAARMFRLLGLHPGPDITVPAAASLAGHRFPAARRLLAELTRANLLSEHTPGRYTCHDLLHVYAAELTGAIDPDDERHAATRRMFDHYTHTAYVADQLLIPCRDPIPVPVTRPAADTSPEHPGTYQGAMAWFAAEFPVLLAAVHRAFATGFDTGAWQLAWAVNTFLYRRGHHRELVTVWGIALRAAERAGDLSARAYAHRLLADAHSRLGCCPEAATHLGYALDLYGRTSDKVGAARTHHSLARWWWRQGRAELALEHAERALTMFQSAGHRFGQAFALNWVGWCNVQIGEYTTALTCCGKALTLHRRLDDPNGEAHTWDGLGYAHHHLARYAEAAACYWRAVNLFRGLGDRHNEAGVLIRLGDTECAAGNVGAAGGAWRRALDLAIAIGRPDAEAVRAKLRSV